MNGVLGDYVVENVVLVAVAGPGLVSVPTKMVLQESEFTIVMEEAMKLKRVRLRYVMMSLISSNSVLFHKKLNKLTF